MSHTKRRSLFLSVVTNLAFLPFVLLGAPSHSPVWGQEFTANIEGVVVDPAGAVIVGATLTLENKATGLQRQTKTDGNGFFTFRLLPVGAYRLTVEAQGFARKVLTDITLEIDQIARVDVTLPVAGTVEEQTVIANAPLVESRSAAIGDVIDNRRVTELPLNGRNFIQLALLVAGTTLPPQGGTTEQWNTGGGRLGFSSNGQRDDRNVFNLDGVTIQDPTLYTVSVNPAPDAIQEFKVLQNSYSAEAGFTGGGQVNITTRSGTNEFHGTVYEFLRNDKLDAKNFFDDPDQPIPPFKRNQFGLSLGGPIVKDRTFFFGNYEGLREVFSPTNVTRLPTLEERNGDFSGVNPLTGQPYRTIFDPDTCPFNCTPFPDNRIPPERIHPLARAVLERIPLPNFATTQPGFNHLNVGRDETDVDQFTIRVDHQLSAKHLLFGRFAFLDSNILDDFVGNLFESNPPPPSGFGTERNDSGRNLAIGLTSILTPAVVNEFRFGYNRFRGPRIHKNCDSGFLDEFVPFRSPGGECTSMPSFAIGAGFADIGDTDIFVPNIRRSDTFQFVDNVVWTKGRHTMKVGADWRYIKFRQTVENFATGIFTFQGDTPAAATGSLFTGQGGLAFADFLLGRPFLSFYFAGDGTTNMRLQYLGFYINDEFRLHPRLTLTFGIREEFYTGPVDQDGQAALLDPAGGNRVIVSAPDGQIDPALLNDPLTQLIASRFGFTFVTHQEAGLPSSLVRPDYSNWQPRVGLAWDVFGTGKTVIRAGFGVYNSLLGLGYSSDIQAPPIAYNLLGLDLGRFLVPGFDQPLSYEVAYTTGNAGTFPIVYDPDIRNGYLYQWSFDIQQEIAPNLVFTAAYSGSHALKLARRSQFNPGVANEPCEGVPDPEVPRRTICTGPSGRHGQALKPGGSAFFRVSDATSDYHGVIVRVEKRFSQGLAFTAGYTFSKSLDIASSLNETRSNPTQAVNEFRLDLERGRSDFDTTHRFVVSGLWELPFGSNKRWLREGVASRLLGGWQLGGILTLQSGFPMTALIPGLEQSVGTNKAGADVQRPDLICDPNLPPSQRRPERWFNTGCFVEMRSFVDDQGVYHIQGNAGRSIIDGPGFSNFDLSIQKNIRWAERHAITFRADFFNLTNHPNFINPGLEMGTPNFGVITEARTPRQIQFSLRYSF